MNNSNSASLLARLRPGDLVTIRRPDGSRATGRADQFAESGWFLRTGPDGMPEAITRANIVRITRDLS